MAEVKPDSAATVGLLSLAEQGNAQSLDELLGRHGPALREFVDFPLDQPLRSRLDPSDVVQDAQLEVVRRMDDYLQRRPMPFHLWIRKTAYERLIGLRRKHLRRAKRSVYREAALPERSSLLLAQPLVDQRPSPSEQLAAHEMAQRVSRAVSELDELDREILLMRHAEKLPYEEIACL